MDVKTLALMKAINTLEALQVQYKIITPDGREYGKLVVATTPKRRFSYPLGEVSNYYKSFLKDFKVGEVREIPFGKYPPENLRGSASGYFTNTYGKGAVITSINREKAVVECLRVA